MYMTGMLGDCQALVKTLEKSIEKHYNYFK